MVVTDTQLMFCKWVDYSDKDVKIAKDVVGADKWSHAPSGACLHADKQTWSGDAIL